MNLSDIAAMAGVPRAAVVAVALPRADAVAVAQGLHAGMRELAERFGVDLVGGDTNAWDGPLVISVTVLGEATARGAVRRAGARPGDVILVTGPLGGSLFAGRHLRPEPRIAEALALHEAVPIHALIDISDGLSSDLGHILDESGGLGAVLDAAADPDPSRCPRDEPARRRTRARSCAQRRRRLRALPGRRGRRRRAAPRRAPCARRALPRRRRDRGAGLAAPRSAMARQRPIEPMGFDHFRTSRRSAMDVNRYRQHADGRP